MELLVGEKGIDDKSGGNHARTIKNFRYWF